MMWGDNPLVIKAQSARTVQQPIVSETSKVDAGAAKPANAPDSFSRKAADVGLAVVEYGALASTGLHAAMLVTAPWWLNATPAVGDLGDLATTAVVAVISGVTFGLANQARKDL